MATAFQTLAHYADRGLCEPFIRSIRFPKFKNLAPHSEVKFTYPISALIGPNGTNKSSILRALQACPNQSNIGDHWFDTDMDPLDKPEKKDPHRYIHSYLTPSGVLAEVIKARVGNVSRGPDYFETSAPRKRDGMATMPGSSPTSDAALRNITRWRPIDKNVVYLDFREELPAYDIFMSFNWSKENNDPTAKKKRIRDRSRHVSAALSDLRVDHDFYGKNRILEAAEELSKTELAAVTHILGRRYLSIRLVKHEYFGVEGYTAALSTDHRNYSEAYAGSGEFAAIMLVRAITRAPDRSLILLDEPETSLHPGAQRQLMRFIAQTCVTKKHQVVMASHSPMIVEELPDSGRKLVDVNLTTGYVEVLSQSASASEAFSRIGAQFTQRSIIVEDQLAREFVCRAARTRGEDYLNSIEVIAVPGGASTLAQRVAPVQAQIDSKCVLLLDGDQRPHYLFAPIADPEQLLDEGVATELRKVRIPDKCLVRDGGQGNDQKQLTKARRTTYTWFYSQAGYLPGLVDPDTLLLELVGRKPGEGSAKQAWADRTKRALGCLPTENVTSQDIWETQRRALADLPDSAEVFEQILKELDRLFNH